jgi:SAM-dependent methyltransferase
MNCRHCKKPLTHTFVDLGFAPPSNAYLTKEDLSKTEKYYPLRVRVCEECWLVQTEDYADANDLFNSNYSYFSSTSTSWLKHAEEYFNKIISRLELNKDSYVIELASNDGYLLKNFKKANIPCLGIEPTNSTADAAEKLGIPVVREFFSESLGVQLRNEGRQADLIIGNNVYAHVPDINDFTKGLKTALKPNGTITLEFPHLLHLIERTQFDTIYHEHFSYLSLHTVSKIFACHGLRIWDVKELSTHGGSLRIYGCHEDASQKNLPSVDSILLKEEEFGLRKAETYKNFQPKVEQIKNNLLTFLIEQKEKGKKVVAYGAAAKGNTLLNYAGIKPDLLPVVFDAAELKQGKFLPGSHIPIVSQKELAKANPDYVLILPWNISKEVRYENAKFLKDGVKFVTTMKHLSVV